MTIPSFRKGDKLRAADLQLLADAVRANRVLPGTGIRITGSPNGTTVAVVVGRSAPPGSSSIQPFQLMVASTEGENPTPCIRVAASTLAGGSSADLGFSEGDDPPYLLTPSKGVLVGGITIDGTTGDVTSRWLNIESTMPEDDGTTFYVEIGTVTDGESPGTWIVSNSRYGPVFAQICRNWYAAEAPFFGVNWS